MGLKITLSPAFSAGLAAGIIIALPLLVFYKIVAPYAGLNDTLIGAIVGATIAGGVSIAGQVLVIRDNERRHNLSDLQTDKALALSLLLKVLDISDHSSKARNASWIRENLSSGLTISEPDAATEKHHLRYFHNPAINLKKIILFEHDETALCIRFKRSELFNALKDLERTYGNLIEAEIFYGECHRQILQHASREPAQVKLGRRIEASVKDLDPRLFFNLCDSRSFIMQFSIEGAQQAEKCRLMLLALLAKEFDLRIGMTMTDDIPGAIQPISR